MKRFFNSWIPKTSYSEVDSKLEISGAYVVATLKNSHYSMASFVSQMDDVTPETVFVFRFILRADDGISNRIVYRFLNRAGETVYSGCLGNGVVFFAPKDAYRLEVTVILNSYHGGSAAFYGCHIEELSPTHPRKWKIAAVSGAYPGEDHGGVFEHTIEKNVANAAHMIDSSANEGSDLVLLTENYNIQNVKGISPYQGAAQWDDRAVQVLIEKARQHRIYIAAGVCYNNGGLIYNTQMIFDPRGNLAGMYVKSHLTDGELCAGYVPGNDITVFDTEIGKIGCSICWDIFFPEHARVLYMRGAEILLHSTESTTPLQLADTAESDSMFIAVAQSCKRTGDIGKTRILDRNGRDLSNATVEKPFACAEIDLTGDHSFFWAKGDQKSSCMGSRRPELYRILSDEKVGYQADPSFIYTTAGYKAEK